MVINFKKDARIKDSGPNSNVCGVGGFSTATSNAPALPTWIQRQTPSGAQSYKTAPAPLSDASLKPLVVSCASETCDRLGVPTTPSLVGLIC